jgi:hypothetical protein
MRRITVLLIALILWPCLVHGAGWYNSSWSTRRAVTVTNTSNANTLTGYARPIDLTSSNFDFSVAKSDGSDIRVTASDGVTLIPYWIQTGPAIVTPDGVTHASWNSASQVGTIWVNVPSIPGSSTTSVYIYYGNAAPTSFQVPPIGAWTKYPGNPVITSDGTHTGSLTPENIVYDSATSKYWMVIDNMNTSKIGLAYSTDLTTWTYNGDLTISGLSNDPDGPCLVISGGTYYLYYSVGTVYGTFSIHYATASAVTGTYTDQGACVSTAGVLGTGWESGRVAEPYVFQLANAHGSLAAGTWVMLYMGDKATAAGSEIPQTGYAYASSPAGPWTKYASNPLIPLGPAGAYDASATRDPHAYEVGGTVYIYCAVTLQDPATTSLPCHTAYYSTTDLVNVTRGNITLSRGNDSAWDSDAAFRGAISLYSNTYYFPYAGSINNVTSNLEIGMATMSAVNTVQGFPPDQVFGFYEGFASTPLPSHAYTRQESGSGGSLTISGNVGTMVSGAGAAVYGIYTAQQFTNGYIFEAYTRNEQAANSTNHYDIMGFVADFSLNIFACVCDGLNASAYWQGMSNNVSNNATVTTTQALDATAYHLHRTWLNSSTDVKIQNDANAFVDISSATATPTNTMYGTLSLGAASSQSSTTMLIKYMLVRPYSSPEPTTSVGSAQSNVTGGFIFDGP